jgi:hypothetical protein
MVNDVHARLYIYIYASRANLILFPRDPYIYIYFGFPP